jgi:hypothetical protein
MMDSVSAEHVTISSHVSLNGRVTRAAIVLQNKSFDYPICLQPKDIVSVYYYIKELDDYYGKDKVLAQAITFNSEEDVNVFFRIEVSVKVITSVEDNYWFFGSAIPRYMDKELFTEKGNQ